MSPETVLEFWFAAGPAAWYKKDAAFDAALNVRFGEAHSAAMAGDLDSWRETAEGALAFVILLDQLSRNIFRETPAAFASDALSLQVTLEAIERGFDTELEPVQRGFLYMPFMHSEDLKIQERSVAAFASLGNANQLDYAKRHKVIIDRFGRYPHRNAILGRQSTPEEVEFLSGPNSSF